jgi:hypothetical protein
MSNITDTHGTGDPEGTFPALTGSRYTRDDGPPFFYLKASGSGTTGWAPVATTTAINDATIVLTDILTNNATTAQHGFMSKADKSKLDGVAPGANLYVHPNHSGDVTSVADGAQTIALNAVTNAKAAQMATKTYKGRTSSGTGNSEDVAVATLKTDLGLVKADVGLGNCDNTSDANKPVSTAQQTALNLKADLASPTLTGTPLAPTAAPGTSTTQLATTAFATTADNLKANLAGPTFTGVPAAPTPAVGTNTTQISTTAYVVAAVPNSSYRTILTGSGSHTAAKVAGTYGMADGDPLAVSGTGTLYPLKTINLVAADFPPVNGLAPKLRLRAQLYTNDVAPTGNFTFGLYPITRPATSGGAGLCIYTLGTVVSGSNGATFTAPAADGLLAAVGADFAFPSDGHYVIGVVTTATVATSAHVHVNASLQMRNA